MKKIDLKLRELHNTYGRHQIKSNELLSFCETCGWLGDIKDIYKAISLYSKNETEKESFFYNLGFEIAKSLKGNQKEIFCRITLAVEKTKDPVCINSYMEGVKLSGKYEKAILWLKEYKNKLEKIFGRSV